LRGENPDQLLFVPIVSIQPHSVGKTNGQRWHALAVQDYESSAVPLGYGGGVVSNPASAFWVGLLF